MNVIRIFFIIAKCLQCKKYYCYNHIDFEDFEYKDEDINDKFVCINHSHVFFQCNGCKNIYIKSVDIFYCHTCELPYCTECVSLNMQNFEKSGFYICCN